MMKKKKKTLRYSSTRKEYTKNAREREKMLGIYGTTHEE
jgi:hypothetical protein